MHAHVQTRVSYVLSSVSLYQLTVAKLFLIEGTVRCHHVYKAVWSPYITEELLVQYELNNIHGDFAVTIVRTVLLLVMYLPWEISRVCWYSYRRVAERFTLTLRVLSPCSSGILEDAQHVAFR